LIRLRVLHPSIAVITAVYLILFAGLSNFRGVGPIPARFSRALILLVVIQMGAGLLNVALLAPVWMQLVHLFLADAVWITLVFLAASTLSDLQSGAVVRHPAQAAPLSKTA
jgi:heme A synthase